MTEVHPVKLEIYGLPYYFGVDPDVYYVIHKNRECMISYDLGVENFHVKGWLNQILAKFDFTIDIDGLVGSEYLRISEMSRECIITAKQISGTLSFLNVEDFEVEWNMKHLGQGGQPKMLCINLANMIIEIY